MADAWDDENTPPPADDDVPPDDEGGEGEGEDRGETLRGLVTDFEKAEGNRPAKFKLAGVKAQCWPYEYGDEEKTEYSDTYQAIKRAAIDDGAVEARGEYKQNSFFSKKANKKISTTVFSVWEADAIEVTSEMKQASEVAKAAVKSAAGGSRGKAQRSESGAGKYKGLTPEEWDEKEARKNQHIDAWAALKIVTPILYNRAVLAVAPGSDLDAYRKAEPTIDQIEKGARALIEVARRLAPASLSSTSASAAASPSTTSEPEPSSAPAPKEPARSKASAKPKKS